MITRQIKCVVTFGLIVVSSLATAVSLRAQGSSAPNSQAVSRTGLLPVCGVDFAFDPAWVDAAQFPSQSASYPNSGVNAVFQQVWDAPKPSGFNVLHFRLDVRDSQAAAARLANLCVWAAGNNVRVVPMLTGADQGQPIGSDLSESRSSSGRVHPPRLAQPTNRRSFTRSLLLTSPTIAPAPVSMRRSWVLSITRRSAARTPAPVSLPSAISPSGIGERALMSWRACGAAAPHRKSCRDGLKQVEGSMGLMVQSSNTSVPSPSRRKRA
jgi:hypothetical protein